MTGCGLCADGWRCVVHQDQPMACYPEGDERAEERAMAGHTPWSKLHDEMLARMTPERRERHERVSSAALDRLQRGVIGYPATLAPDDNGTVLITFIDVPAVSFGRDES